MQANQAERSDVRETYRRDALLLSVVWLIYPLVLLVAPDGFGVIGDTLSVLAIAILDVLAKVVFGLLSVRADATITERDLGEVGTVGTAYDTRTRVTA